MATRKPHVTSTDIFAELADTDFLHLPAGVRLGSATASNGVYIASWSLAGSVLLHDDTNAETSIYAARTYTSATSYEIVGMWWSIDPGAGALAAFMGTRKGSAGGTGRQLWIATEAGKVAIWPGQVADNEFHFTTTKQFLAPGIGTSAAAPQFSIVGATNAGLFFDSTSGDVGLAHGGVSRLSVNSTHVSLDIGRLKFPATQNASTDANTFDDYEEGTWTPSPFFGGGNTGLTLGVQSGTYTKLGRVLAFEFRIQFSNKGSSTGAMTITGVPFSRAAGNGAWTTGYINSFATSLHNVVGDVTGTTCNVFKTVAGATTTMQNTDCLNSSDIIGFGQIFT